MNFSRITIEPGKMSGQPCVRGYRITVRRLLSALARLESRAEVLREFPGLEDEDITQALHFAAAQLPDEEVELTPQQMMASAE